MYERFQFRCSDEFKDKYYDIKRKLGYDKLSNERFIEKAIEIFFEVEYMDKEASMLNDNILRAIDSSHRQVENRMGNRICAILSELSIQSYITLSILKENKYLTDDEIMKIRIKAVQNMKDSNGLINYKEIEARR